MSQGNVELVRAAFEAWNAGQMDVLREIHDPDVVARPPKGWPVGPLVGWEAVSEEWRQLRDTWDADVAEPIGDFIDAADRVVVRFCWRGTGAGMELTGVYSVREGRIFGVEYFWDHAEGLQAAGVQE